MNSVQRITNLDFIRGFALLGILVINVIAFGLPLTATTNSSTYGIENTLDWIVLVISSVFFEQKMIKNLYEISKDRHIFVNIVKDVFLP